MPQAAEPRGPQKSSEPHRRASVQVIDAKPLELFEWRFTKDGQVLITQMSSELHVENIARQSRSRQGCHDLTRMVLIQTRSQLPSGDPCGRRRPQDNSNMLR